jgi:Kef-type K+ transport system membrane component KefB
MQHPEGLLFSLLLQLIVMIGAARLMNSLLRRIGQPGVVGEILAGLMLGPSLLGHFAPGVSRALFAASTAEPITMISQIGLVLLMFQIGMDFDFAHLREPRNRRAVATIALLSLSVPFGLGTLLGRLSAASLAPGSNPVVYSLFCGVGLAITAVPILGRILREYGLTRTELGVVAISAAAVNDVAGWVLLAAVSAYARSLFSVSALSLQLLGLALLVAALWWVLRPLVAALVQRYPLQHGALPSNLMALALCLTFVLAVCTDRLGIFAIFGGFASGLLFHRHRAWVQAWHAQVGRFVMVFFLPVFFTFTGLRTNVLGLSRASDLAWLAILLIGAIGGKMLPVYLGARLSGFDPNRSWILGTLMNTRALMELIVLNIGYDLGFLPQRVFTMLVIMAVTTTVMTGPLLRLLLARSGHVVPAGIEA